MKWSWKLALGLAASSFALRASADVRLFEHDNFTGRSFATFRAVVDLNRFGFNDRASSVIVSGNRWVLCQDARFAGRCVTLRPGRYRSLSAMGLNDRVSSLRPLHGR